MKTFKQAILAATVTAMVALTGCGEPLATQDDINNFWNNHSCPEVVEVNTAVAVEIGLNISESKLNSCEALKNEYLHPQPALFSYASPLVDEKFTGDQSVVDHAKSMEEAVQYGMAHLETHHLTVKELQDRLNTRYAAAIKESQQELTSYNTQFEAFVEKASDHPELVDSINRTDEWNDSLDQYRAAINARIAKLTAGREEIQKSGADTVLVDGVAMTNRQMLMESIDLRFKFSHTILLRR